MTTPPLGGKVAIVTGGSRGIGHATAALLAEHGAAVVVSGRDADRVQRAAHELEERGGSAHGMVADAAKREDADRLVETAKERFGRVDILVNNAGITRDGLLIRMKDEDWDRVMETNLRGAFLMTRAAAKAGLIGLTKASARELAHWGILVNAVAPGLIETDMAAAIPVEAREALLAQVPLKRIGTAREVAEMVGFLAGDGAAYVTGQVFHVNGGLYI